MKKTFFVLLLILLFASTSWGAGSCTQSPERTAGGFFRVVIACTGDGADGSIPDTALSTDIMALLLGTHYLFSVSAYPTTGGPAPDAADVFVLDASGEDLLGSVDGGTTANKGLNLIHATLKKTTFPYSHYATTISGYTPAVVNTLTLRVKNQATVSAKYTVELVFFR